MAEDVEYEKLLAFYDSCEPLDWWELVMGLEEVRGESTEAARGR